MKISKKNNKTVWLVLALVIALATTLLIYLWLNKSTSTAPYKEPESTVKNDIDSVNKTPVQNETITTDSPSKASIPVIITNISETPAGIRLRADIGTITNEGSCTLVVTDGNKTVSLTSGIQALASSSTCKGFDVDANALNAGIWKFTLNVSSDGKTGTAEKSTDIGSNAE